MADWPIKIEATMSPETVDKIVDAVIGIISPIREASELAKDYIQYRRNVLKLVFDKALRAAASEQMKAPPPKFMLEFADRASREDPESDLIELWAKLLSSACSDYDSSLQTFIRILDEIGPTEAKVLQQLASTTEGYSGPAPLSSLLHSARDKVERIIPRHPLTKFEDIVSIAKEVFETRFFGSISAISVMLPFDEFANERAKLKPGVAYPKKQLGSLFSSLYEGHPLAFDILERNRLIETHVVRITGEKRFVSEVDFGEVRFAEVTALGQNLLARCVGGAK